MKASQSRGNDATGIAYIDQKEGLVVVKEGIDADGFVKSPEFLKATENLPPIVIGHTRAATGGATASEHDNKNNHPFYSMESGIAVVHNGIVDDKMWRKTVGADGGIKRPFVSGTDSEVFLRMVETLLEDNKDVSMETAIYDSAYNISGTFALVFIKKDEPNRLWFAAHTNPVCLAYNQKENYIVFASTEKIIEEAMSEYKFFLDFFIVEQIPRLIINQLKDDYILTLDVVKDAPKGKDNFILNTKALKIHPSSTSYFKGRRGA